ncbi:NUDIX hydrolase [Chloroflexota bacterium]
MAEEKTLSSRVIYEGRVLKLRVDNVRTADGRESTREIVEHSDCIAIVPVDADGNILLVSQYRKAVEKEILEIPAGGIEPGETPDDAVRREMREETGYLPRRIQRLGGFYSAPGYSSEYLYLYLATDLTPSPLRAEDTDDITLVRLPAGQIPELIATGRLADAKSLAGLLLFLEYQKQAGQRMGL